MLKRSGIETVKSWRASISGFAGSCSIQRSRHEVQAIRNSDDHGIIERMCKYRGLSCCESVTYCPDQGLKSGGGTTRTRDSNGIDHILLLQGSIPSGGGKSSDNRFSPRRSASLRSSMLSMLMNCTDHFRDPWRVRVQQRQYVTARHTFNTDKNMKIPRLQVIDDVQYQKRQDRSTCTSQKLCDLESETSMRINRQEGARIGGIVGSQCVSCSDTIHTDPTYTPETKREDKHRSCLEVATMNQFCVFMKPKESTAQCSSPECAPDFWIHTEYIRIEIQRETTFARTGILQSAVALKNLHGTAVALRNHDAQAENFGGNHMTTVLSPHANEKLMHKWKSTSAQQYRGIYAKT